MIRLGHVGIGAGALVLALAACQGRDPAGGVDGGTSDARPPMPDAMAPVVPPEIDGQLVINEVMTSNVYTLLDETGQAGDWIEIYNPTDRELPLTGYALTDHLDRPDLHRLQGVIIGAGRHLVLWADGRPEVGAMHLDFKLDADGGDLGLARPDGSYIDRISYGEQETDFSAARTPDGTTRWEITWHPTPAAANAGEGGAPAPPEQPGTPPEAVPAAGDLSAHILGYDELPTLGLLVSPAAAASLEAAPFVEVPAQLVFEGRTYGPVAVRLKGQNSFLPFSQKPSLRIKVDGIADKARFWGLKDLTLNNMAGDYSMMHERLAYWVMREAGVPASRANHLELVVNGQPYGLYTNVETVKKKLLGRWFADDTGSLFEATDVDFTAAYVDRYELEAGPDDRSLIAGVAAALTMPSADAAIAAAAQYADLAAFQRYWAVCSVIGQFDAFPYSFPGDDYFVYANPSTHRLAFMPWGMDETFYSGAYPVTATSSVFARRCRETPSCFDAYVAQTWEVLALTEQLDLAGERLRVQAQIAPLVAADSRKPYSDQQVADSQAALYWFIAERRMNLAAMLSP